MERTTAQEIINKYKLIPGKISRKLLLAIKNDIPISQIELPKEVTLEQIIQIKYLYQKKLKELGSKISEGNSIFYHLIQDIIPQFRWWRLPEDKKNVFTNTPRIQNLPPSLLSLLLNKISLDDDTLLHRKYFCFNTLSTPVIKIISNVLRKIEPIYPSEQYMEDIVSWLNAGLHGEVLTIFSPICPDYSFEITDDISCRYKHTFNELGSGIGLIAQRILQALPILTEALAQCGIKKINITVGFADFEAYSLANLERLKISKIEFLNRLTESKSKFIASCSVKANIQMITELIGGHDRWFNLHSKFLDTMNQGNFGKSDLNDEMLLKIISERKNLYDRWYGEKNSSDHISHLLNQGAEYAALGLYLSKIKNCLVLGADNNAMKSFYNITKVIPTLYLKRYYC